MPKENYGVLFGAGIAVPMIVAFVLAGGPTMEFFGAAMLVAMTWIVAAFILDGTEEKPWVHQRP